ncbi:hypothetical protein RclHR1_06350001 [Rhizophagus clarus]|uniref:Uncharacterized protein n=1 Tax=Rhizophagus clarus TaxID=94130 RepID=A0A2Z6SI70_9GLOM|nr:hypothetical protein RclHR1_06350001 [Rhizophagus clarus]
MFSDVHRNRFRRIAQICRPKFFPMLFVLIEKQNSKISARIEPNSEIDESFEIDREIFDAIDQASKHAANNDIFDFLNIKDNTDDHIHQHKQIISILNTTKIYSNEGQTQDPIIRYLLLIKELDYSTMIALQKYHEAYNSRPIERQYHVYYKKQTNTVIHIESANITQDFPLQQNDFVIALYGKKICVAKIIAMYYKGYGNYCYTQDAINQLEDLSYVSLQVYLPIHLNIFASQTLEGYILFIYHCLQNILYHINANELIISESSLTLKGMAQNIFNYFNRNDIRNTIVNMI